MNKPSTEKDSAPVILHTEETSVIVPRRNDGLDYEGRPNTGNAVRVTLSKTLKDGDVKKVVADTGFVPNKANVVRDAR